MDNRLKATTENMKAKAAQAARFTIGCMAVTGVITGIGIYTIGLLLHAVAYLLIWRNWGMMVNKLKFDTRWLI